MNRNSSRLYALSASAVVAWLFAAACSIDDRTVDTFAYPEDDGGGGGGTGTGGRGSGGKASGGTTGTGGKASGGASTGGTGGKGSGGTTPSSGGQTGTGGTPPNPLEQAIQSYAEANCALNNQCQGLVVSRLFGTVESCVSAIVELQTLAAALPDSKLTAASYTACADAYWEGDCDVAFAVTAPAPCRVPGGRANGDPCNSANQCSSLFCETVGYDCGVCAPQPAVGKACQNSLECAQDQTCQIGGQYIGTCRVPLALNAPCTATGVGCAQPNVCASGKCTAAPNTYGASCDDTTGLICDINAGLICNTGTCDYIPTAEIGDYCDAGVVCLDLGLCSDNVCVAGPARGDTCDPSNGQSCHYPEICISRGTSTQGYCESPEDALLCEDTGTGT